jgi:hypothetical protein
MDGVLVISGFAPWKMRKEADPGRSTRLKTPLPYLGRMFAPKRTKK